MTGRPKTFFLDRTADPSGVSGVGKVAWGVLFPDGAVALRWIDRVASSTAIWNSLDDVKRVHGHAGTTAVVFDTDQAAIDMSVAIAGWHDEATDELQRLRTGLTDLCSVYRDEGVLRGPGVPVTAIRDLLDRTGGWS